MGLISSGGFCGVFSLKRNDVINEAIGKISRLSLGCFENRIICFLNELI